MEKIGNDTFKYNGKLYKVVKKEIGHYCNDTCPLYSYGRCGTICSEMYNQLKNPGFTYEDVVLVEVPENENKETNMEEKEPNYKALYEQEHKKYGDAVERMKSWMNGEHPECFSEAQKAAEFVFPEAKESKGEKIRKFLIKCVQQPMGTNLLNGIKKDDVIAWLEKQDEQKPAWSEDDEKMLVLCASSVRTRHNDGLLTTEEYERASLWLKSLKERIQSQPKQELNEETVNEYINLGLPSGTLWKSANEEGYYTFDNAVEKFGDLLPTKEQWEELIDYCLWVRSNNGYVVTGPNNNTIFLPADGVHVETGVYDVGTDGHYWSCTNDKESYAWDMYFDRDNLDVYLGLRYYGRSVRLVK